MDTGRRITSTDSSGQDGWNNIQKAVAGSGGAVTVVNHPTFAPTDVSVTTQLSKIKASNPQALFIWTTGTPLTTVLKGMQHHHRRPHHRCHLRAAAGGLPARLQRQRGAEPGPGRVRGPGGPARPAEDGPAGTALAQQPGLVVRSGRVQGTLFAPPRWAWHQHFNLDTGDTSRYLAVQDTGLLRTMRLHQIERHPVQLSPEEAAQLLAASR